MKGGTKIGGVVSALTRNENFTKGAQTLPKKCRDLGIFSVPCTIGECTFADAMLDLGASINVMPTSIYKALNFDMEDETVGKESTLILGRPFLMTARTKIDLHARTFSMEFGNTLVQFNIFKAMKHPTKDHSLFGIDMIEELVEEYFQLDSCSEDIEDFSENADVTSYSRSITEEADYEEVHNLPNFEDNNDDIADLDFEAELLEVIEQVCNHENLECVNNVEVKVVETNKPSSAQLATIFAARGKSATEG
ncbi:hypothetical protein CR513_46961, partial [Mucuna pruriens]